MEILAVVRFDRFVACRRGAGGVFPSHRRPGGRRTGRRGCPAPDVPAAGWSTSSCRRSRNGSRQSKGKIRADVAHEQAAGDGVPRVGAVVPAGGRRDQEAVPVGERAGAPAVGDRTGVVVAVRLRRRAGHRRTPRRCCSARGWPGPGSGSSSRCGTGPSRAVFAALDAAFRLLGGAPTYILTDNEKSVTVEHVARIPVRNQQVVAFARFYGVTVHTCEVRDPASQGWGGEHRETGEGRHRPDRHQPRRRVRLLRRPGGGVHRVHGDGERPDPPDHEAGPGRHAGTGTAPAAPGAGAAAHGHVRGNPDGGGEHPDGVLPGRVVLGAAHPARGDGVGPLPRRRPGRTGGDRARR